MTIKQQTQDNKIGINIRRFRKIEGYSMENVAQRSDLSLNTIFKIERGSHLNPTIHTLAKIAKALNVSVDDLILDVPTKEKQLTKPKARNGNGSRNGNGNGRTRLINGGS